MGPLVIFAALGLVLLATSITLNRLRHRRNLDALLRPIIESHGLRLIDSKPTPWFSVGPFPRLAFKVGGLQTTVFGIPGEYWTYRIVRIAISDAIKEVWVRLYFEAFELHETKWEPPLQSLTQEAGHESQI